MVLEGSGQLAAKRFEAFKDGFMNGFAGAAVLDLLVDALFDKDLDEGLKKLKPIVRKWVPPAAV